MQQKILIWFLGFISGFTLMISGNTLNFWLSKQQLDIKIISSTSLLAIPYAINFLWSPILDRYKIPGLFPILGNRLSWILVVQSTLSITIYMLSLVNPLNNLTLFFCISFFISFLSSTQDSILGGFRTEIINHDFKNNNTGIYIFGYRIGMLFSSSGAIYISTYLGWNIIYKIFSSIILFFFPLLLLLCTLSYNQGYNKKLPTNDNKLLTLNSFKTMLSSMGSPNYIVILLLFLILYRLPNNLITPILNSFYIHIGYNELEISYTNKFYSIIFLIIGGLYADYIIKKKGIIQGLFLFGIVHTIAHLLFIAQEIYGKNNYFLLILTIAESLTSGMCMATYMAFITSLCTSKFKATQYSFLLSTMGLSRSIFSILSGYIISYSGWIIFFIITIIGSIPSLILLFLLQKNKKTLS